MKVFLLLVFLAGLGGAVWYFGLRKAKGIPPGSGVNTGQTKVVPPTTAGALVDQTINTAGQVVDLFNQGKKVWDSTFGN